MKQRGAGVAGPSDRSELAWARLAAPTSPTLMQPSFLSLNILYASAACSRGGRCVITQVASRVPSCGQGAGQLGPQLKRLGGLGWLTNQACAQGAVLGQLAWTSLSRFFQYLHGTGCLRRGAVAPYRKRQHLKAAAAQSHAAAPHSLLDRGLASPHREALLQGTANIEGRMALGGGRFMLENGPAWCFRTTLQPLAMPPAALCAPP